ncbi:phytoene/squalene synthase family protein [Pontibaca salina]|uniref:Squalene/phytoene synthase family protein n=1 Tax=Pontibaca salina TaxID=2795731 RepID=A0A934HMY6_9RHOB|nr:squalene/phytoene synthase family protein [Pontibaca salina]MBI6629911.1 squalene/phytoene synthase family protein [Pontibaca salina]
MQFDEDLTACAALVERSDPDRFRATMAAPPPARRVLFPLYALNVEVSRAPWVTQEPMIAEMRLQWWREALEQIAKGETPRRHEVITPLARVLSPELGARLDAMVAARRWDIYTDPFEDEAHFDRYIDETSGTLIWAAARSLGEAEEAVVRDFAYGVGVANWLRAIPDLEARGRVPLLDGRAEAVAALADRALVRLKRARAMRRAVSPEAAPAMLTGWQAASILREARRMPSRVGAGVLGTSEARARLALIARAATGRW